MRCRNIQEGKDFPFAPTAWGATHSSGRYPATPSSRLAPWTEVAHARLPRAADSPSCAVLRPSDLPPAFRLSTFAHSRWPWAGQSVAFSITSAAAAEDERFSRSLVPALFQSLRAATSKGHPTVSQKCPYGVSRPLRDFREPSVGASLD